MSNLAPRAQYPSFSFAELGAEIEGIIVVPPEDRQARDFDSGQPKFWPDGNPVIQTKIVLRPDGGTDQAVYAQGRMARAITDAIRKSGADDLEVNGRLRVKHHDVGEPKGKGKPPKLYEASYVPPVDGPADDDEPPF